MADRYTYVPLIGLFIAITWSFIGIAHSSNILRYGIIGLCSCILIGLSISTHIQLRNWHDRVSIWEHALKSCNGNNCVANNNLGVIMNERGKFDEAAFYYRKAIEQYPKFTFAHFNLGVVMAKTKNFDEAAYCFRKVIEQQPELALSHYYLGRVLQMQGKNEEAISSYRKSLFLQPNLLEAQTDLKALLNHSGLTQKKGN